MSQEAGYNDFHSNEKARVNGRCPCRSAELTGRVRSLTRRQREVLQCLGMGMTTKDIAAHLTLTEHTVKIHTSRVLEALGVESRLQAGIVGYTYMICRHGFDGKDNSNE
ncbi:helix-turn-helix transcriptional regulator [Microbispora sp. NPDC088329]|uniref:helix-turn-helix domain-containing protein n=1 Tax=Microbispora sp. NPDC088329 TaxID=3154869 RepID=UPI00342D9736